MHFLMQFYIQTTADQNEQLPSFAVTAVLNEGNPQYSSDIKTNYPAMCHQAIVFLVT